VTTEVAAGDRNYLAALAGNVDLLVGGSGAPR
jgi:hypothetical protein